MERNRLQYLLEQYTQGKASASEIAELNTFAQQLPENQPMLSEMIAEGFSQHREKEGDPIHFSGMLDKVVAVDKDFVKDKALTHQDNPTNYIPASQPRITVLRRWWAAASVILLLVTISYFWNSNKTDTQHVTTVAEGVEILPGKEGAILTLANGAQVSLDSIQNGTIALQGGVTAKVVNGTLLYEGVGNEVVYNTMSTPKGRQFHVTLPDGTQVWLNAASSIRYPTSFAGKERQVTIKGEAYFEVVKGTVPFIVNADDRAEITVLGTHFNINSYYNEENLSTTLLEGSVRVTRGGESITIAPGEQANIATNRNDAAEKIKVIKATDTDKVIAWKKGMFDFEGATLTEVMNQLERWYDIEVVYQGRVPNITFWGGMTKDIPLEDLLKGLKQSEVNFKTEGRKLIVLP